jgi:uncharacterized membrane protein
MNRTKFLQALREGLTGLSAADIDEILADYASYFDEADAAGRSEEDVAAALGDPRRLARELRAETGLRRWEDQRSLRTVATALLALGGLAAVDLVFMLPLLFIVTLVMLIFAIAIFGVGLVGLGMLLSLVKVGHYASISAMMMRALTGIGILSAGVGCGALLLLALNGTVTMLGRYARLHYRLLKPQQHAW